MSKIRTIKRGLKKPPLSTLDKIVYYLLIIIMFVIACKIMIALCKDISMAIDYADKEVVAVQRNKPLVMVCVLPFSNAILMSLTIPFCAGLKYRQPIFGNRKFKSSLLHPTMKTYPIFSKEFREKISDGTRKKVKKFVKISVIGILLTALLLPFGFFKRDVLSNDNQIHSYNVVNVKKGSKSIENADKLIISANRDVSGGKSRTVNYIFSVALVYGEETYEFTSASFYEMSNEETIKYMLYLKELFGDGKYEVNGVKWLETIARRKKLDGTERALLYELFDYEGE